MTAPRKKSQADQANPFLTQFDGEMRYLREAGLEFVRDQPDAARRLGMQYGQEDEQVRAVPKAVQCLYRTTQAVALLRLSVKDAAVAVRADGRAVSRLTFDLWLGSSASVSTCCVSAVPARRPCGRRFTLCGRDPSRGVHQPAPAIGTRRRAGAAGAGVLRFGRVRSVDAAVAGHGREARPAIRPRTDDRRRMCIGNLPVFARPPLAMALR